MKEKHKSDQQDSTLSQEININSDSEIPGINHLSNPDTDQNSDYEKLESELNEQKDKYLRLWAEFENFKKRTSLEKLELRQVAAKDLVSILLEVLDDADRAENQMMQTDDISVVRDGTFLVFQKLRNSLQQKGLKAMESIGQPFDEEKHEAVSVVPAGEDMHGKIVDELMKGYYLNDKLIRHAKVVVGQ